MPKIIKNGKIYPSDFTTLYYYGNRAASDQNGNYIDETYENIKALNFMKDASYHNSIYRGKDITSYFTDGSLYTRISSGTFDDLYIGDFFNATINNQNVVCRLAGFDTFLMKGKNPLLPHHAVIVPDSALINGRMYSTNMTNNAFKGSEVYNILESVVNNWLEETFGGHLLPHNELISVSVDPSTPSSSNSTMLGGVNGLEEVQLISALMTEMDVYGTLIYTSNGTDIVGPGIQLPLFFYEPRHITIPSKKSWWLGNVYNNSCFCGVNAYGRSSSLYASNTAEIRPRWLIT